MKKKDIIIGLIFLAIFVQVIALFMWLIPISGFFIMPAVSMFPLIAGFVCWLLSKEWKALRIVSLIIWIIALLLIVLDVFGIVYTFWEMSQG